MLKWYEDKELKIFLSLHPKITERYICPCCSKEEKKTILKKPYENFKDLKVEIEYEGKNNGRADLCKNGGKCEIKYQTEKYSFTIPKGFCFDGASIPRIFWRLIGSNTDNTFLIAAMIHDFMCENHSVVDNNRYLSTLIFNALLEIGGVNPPKRWIMKHSVDNFQKFCRWGKNKK